MRGKRIADVSTAIRPRQAGVDPAEGVVPALTLLSHPAAHRAGERALLQRLAAGRPASISRNEPDFVRPGAALGQPLADPFISRKPILLAPTHDDGVRVTVEAGSDVVMGEPVRGSREISRAELVRGVPLEIAGRVALLLHLSSPPPKGATATFGMVGDSDGIRQVRGDIARLVDLSVPVLICGETGTGKELVARAIHEHGSRRGGPFVSVNLGAIPRELAAAELFGARRGAYTGATRDREGFFRSARGGTLFLDEIGEASPDVQAMLLRVIETGEMYPVGGDEPVATDVRLVAATDADLEEGIEEGRFKAPLLHRLAGYEIRLPPLRERREDIGALFLSFAREELEAIGEAHKLSPEDPYSEPWLPASLAALLAQHPWPGNIRQLRNLTRQLVIGSRGSPRLQIQPRLAWDLSRPDVPPSHRRPTGRSAARDDDSGVKSRRRASEIPEAEIVAALRESAWDFKAAADRLGIPRSSIYDALDRCPGVRMAGDLAPEEIARCYRECGGDLDLMVQRLEVSGRALKRRLRELGLAVKGA